MIIKILKLEKIIIHLDLVGLGWASDLSGLGLLALKLSSLLCCGLTDLSGLGHDGPELVEGIGVSCSAN